MKNKVKKILKMFRCLFLYYYYSAFCRIKKIDNSNVWLLSERGTEARDNAYHFYKYLKKEHPEINVKYVISKKSVDAQKIEENDIVDYGSKEHYILFKTAGKLISTHIMGYSPDMSLFSRLDKKRKKFIRGKRVFLQHGITKDYIDYLRYENTKLDLFISGALPEYNYILNNFGYNSNNLKYTGFARFDNLISRDKNQILVMPTFRKWLNYTEKFEESEYYIKWNSLINNKELIDYLEENDLYLIFYPHYEVQKYINKFITDSNRIILADFNNYDVQQLLIDSKMLITDYSSVYFDFAYMKKPVIYYQFDINQYRSGHYKEGYFNYEKNGFGPVCFDEKSVINNIINYDESYNKRVNDFFAYTDLNNCERIYNEIVKL